MHQRLVDFIANINWTIILYVCRLVFNLRLVLVFFYFQIVALVTFAQVQVTKAVVQRCSVKKLCLEIWQKSQENTCARVLRPAPLLKKTAAQVFCCEFCQISKNTFLQLVAASKVRGSIILKFQIEFTCTCNSLTHTLPC